MTSFGKLYTHIPNPRAFKILAAARLNNLTIEFPPYEHFVTNKTDEFLAKFPTGKAPAFEGSDGTYLVESDAIAQYVAQSGPRAGQLLGRDALTAAKIRQWICFFDGEVNSTALDLLRWRFGVTPFDEATETKALAQLTYGLSVLEKHLNTDSFLAGEELTLAHLTGAGVLSWAFQHIIDEPMRKQYPNVVAWYLKIIQNEEVKEVFGEPDFIKKRRDGPE
ncbi:fusarin C cluster-translation Elongation factor [Fusarium austroafricanum]|uniref:Fusarin C cluster-translation Elongation factor n=1 Tax=Fusarium austroafricanum TaxID=2364996 RepID=A0A8H4JXK3_9HYPO|nr:fusarin C cluster-translation Elongation factor [Fusarium austroafricanum]